MPSAQLPVQRHKTSRRQPLLPTLRPKRGTLHFWSATPLVRKAIRACLRAQVALPGRLTPLAPKPHSLQIFSGSPFRSSPISLALIQAPKRASRPRSAATRRGRVPSIPARCGRWRWDISMPAPTLPAARIAARFNACYCSQSGTKRDQREVNSWPQPPSSNA